MNSTVPKSSTADAPTGPTAASTPAPGFTPAPGAPTGASAPQGTSPRPRGAARREALLEAVLRIVAAVGPDAVTHRRVAEEAGLPLASTTYWFDSKEHLLSAAIELAAERDIARLLAAAAAFRRQRQEGADADPLDAALDAVTEPDQDGACASRSSLIAMYALLLEAARRPALREVANRWTEAYLLALGQLLEQAGSRHPREDAELLLGAADGLLIEQLSTGSANEVRPRLRRLAEALLVRP